MNVQLKPEVPGLKRTKMADGVGQSCAEKARIMVLTEKYIYLYDAQAPMCNRTSRKSTTRYDLTPLNFDPDFVRQNLVALSVYKLSDFQVSSFKDKIV